ncbi:hypothetical protein ARMSODRAFT_1032483 [Armillaria solidipes]|uniref:Uncharacterized protein n=1 Tax=Armillaria solidipes TaxID=1076256 RepID=A0A2H3C5I7_9AGAR|nr:hypothetical protein ARMSODRAFT_1032483 [Armillaria solidipes]
MANPTTAKNNIDTSPECYWRKAAATVPTTPSIVPSITSQNMPLLQKVARTVDQIPCAMGTQGGGDGSIKSPSLPPSQARESVSSAPAPGNTNHSQNSMFFPGYAYCNTLNTTPIEISNKISIQELGVSSLGSITAIRDVLQASTRAKNKYQLGAEVTATLIDLCKMQLATLA